MSMRPEFTASGNLKHGCFKSTFLDVFFLVWTNVDGSSSKKFILIIFRKSFSWEIFILDYGRSLLFMYWFYNNVRFFRLLRLCTRFQERMLGS